MHTIRWQPVPKIIHQKRLNQHIILYRGSADLINDKFTVRGKVIIKISWHPYPNVNFQFVYHSKEEKIDLDNQENLELKLIDIIPQSRIKVHIHSYQGWGSGKSQLSGYFIEPFIQGMTDKLFSVAFHITNFWFFNISNSYEEDDEGNFKPFEGWLSFDGQFVFEYANWRFVLSSLDNCFELEESLITEGGYGVTHICLIEKSDHTQFSFDEAYEQIKAFAYYLSFARGLWIPPILVSGFDENGNLLFEEWRTNPIIAGGSFKYDYSWADCDSTELVAAFPGFMKKWNDEIWQGVIQNTIQWHIESLINQTNTGIILIQSSLEKLAWTFLKNNECLTADGFKSIKAADQIRLLLKFLEIEIEALDKYPEISKKAKELNWTDSLQAISEVRNAIVHPQVKKSKTSHFPSEKILSEAFTIYHNYLEKCLLKLFDYPYSLD